MVNTYELFIGELMMDKEIAISKEVEVKITLEAGKLGVEAVYGGAMGGATAKVFVSTDMVIDAICKKIPGEIDNALGDLLKAGLNKA